MTGPTSDICDLPSGWPALQGMCARACARPKGANPYPRRSAERAAWRAGWQKTAVSSFHVKRGPGRGRSHLARRREWSAAEEALLAQQPGRAKIPELVRRLCAMAPDGEAGRNAQAVKNKRARMRKKGEIR